MMRYEDDHTSAEMERLRVRRLWRAFAGGSDPSGPRSTLGRGLVASVVIAVLVGVGTFVAGVIQATTENGREGGGVTTPATTQPPETTATTPTTQPPATTTAPPAPPPESVDVAVLSTAAWTDTGVDLARGDVVQVEASGTVTAAIGDPRTVVGPDGSLIPAFTTANRDENGVQVGGGHAALIGMIGESGPPFLIGAANTLSIPTDGRLFLGVNDGGLDNNEGQFDVTLTVTR